MQIYTLFRSIGKKNSSHPSYDNDSNARTSPFCIQCYRTLQTVAQSKLNYTDVVVSQNIYWLFGEGGKHTIEMNAFNLYPIHPLYFSGPQPPKLPLRTRPRHMEMHLYWVNGKIIQAVTTIKSLLSLIA
jgi:hypothetical protein